MSTPTPTLTPRPTLVIVAGIVGALGWLAAILTAVNGLAWNVTNQDLMLVLALAITGTLCAVVAACHLQTQRYQAMQIEEIRQRYRDYFAGFADGYTFRADHVQPESPTNVVQLTRPPINGRAGDFK